MLQKLKELIRNFGDQKWTSRRDNARMAAELLCDEMAKNREAEKLLWEGICSSASDVSYWSKRVLEKSASLDFLIDSLDNEELMKDPVRSRHLFDLFSFRFSEIYPYLLANFSYFNKDNQLHLIRLLSKNGDRNLIEFFSSLSFSTDHDLKLEAVNFLSGFHDKEALLGLFSYLNDDLFKIKSKAAFKLSKGLEFYEMEGGKEYLGWFLPLIPEKLKDRFIALYSSAEPAQLAGLIEEVNTAQRFILLRLLPVNDDFIRILLDQPLIEFQYLALLCYKERISQVFRHKIFTFLESDYPEMMELSLRISRESNVEVEPKFLDRLLKTDDLEIKKIVLDLISINPAEQLFDSVMGMVHSDSTEERFFALYPMVQYYRFNDKKHLIIEALVQCFKDPYWPVRNQASLCFKYLSQEVIDFLIMLLGTEENRDILYWTISSLGQFSDERIPQALLNFYQRTSEFDLKRIMLEVLGNFPDDRVCELYKQQIRSQEYKFIVLKSLHHMSADKIEEIIEKSSFTPDELPPWLKVRGNKEEARSE